MDDNARPHRAVIVQEYHEGLSLERIEWPARSPDSNLIEHFWDYLGRQVAALSPPPRSLGELEHSLLRVWSSLPISVTDNLIDIMEIRCLNAFKLGYGLDMLCLIDNGFTMPNGVVSYALDRGCKNKLFKYLHYLNVGTLCVTDQRPKLKFKEIKASCSPSSLFKWTPVMQGRLFIVSKVGYSFFIHEQD
ncbi:DDE_3 domain-containing protein [Trichonephila clavipes]|nr:DDE_3 domain-containing protein [Trichonephila clavipes]